MRNQKLKCKHIKHVKPRLSKNWYPWCLECLCIAPAKRIYTIREQLNGEYLEAYWEKV